MNPSVLLTSDWHLREDTPVCRTDNYWEAMWGKIEFIRNLAIKHKAYIINAGDLFHKPKPSPYLLGHAIRLLPKMIVCPGQHDLPNHNLDLYNKCGLDLLDAAYVLEDQLKYQKGSGNALYIFPFGEILLNPVETDTKRSIAIIHTLVHETESPVKIMGGVSAESLLRKMSGFDLIVTGDNHKSFIVKHKGRLLVNPGSLMRMSADQEGHKPSVYLWDAESNEVERVYLPIKQGVINREHIEAKQQRDQRIDAFVSHLQKEYDIGLSLENNLKLFFNTNRVQKSVQQLVWEAVK